MGKGDARMPHDESGDGCAGSGWGEQFLTTLSVVCATRETEHAWARPGRGARYGAVGYCSSVRVGFLLDATLACVAKAEA